MVLVLFKINLAKIKENIYFLNKNRIMVVKSWGSTELGLTVNGYGVPLGMMEIF